MRNRILRNLALAAVLALPAAAHALLFRAYVSPYGSDANPCTLQQPCRLLPAALTAVADGGEIWMLDSANYNTSQVNIAKSVTILAVSGAVGSIVATGGGHGIHVNAPGGTVALRNLVIVELTDSASGIYIQEAARTHISDCDIANVNDSGITALASGGIVTVRHTVVRGAGNAGFHATGSVTATLEDVRLKGGGYGVLASGNSRVTVAGSVLAGNNVGAAASASAATPKLVIADSVVTGGIHGILGQTLQSGDVAQVTASRNTVSHHSGAGFRAYQAAGSTVTIVTDANVVAENGTGFQFALNAPTIYTRGNNTARFNATDVSGGALTPLAAK